jgi:hypothetical protein
MNRRRSGASYTSTVSPTFSMVRSYRHAAIQIQQPGSNDTHTTFLLPSKGGNNGNNCKTLHVVCVPRVTARMAKV